MANEKTTSKPVFKKWWFWVIIAVVILFLGAGSSPSSETETTNNNNSKSETKKQITVIDFSAMSYGDITVWCEENNIKCYEKEDYSETVKKGSFVSQSVKEGEKVNEGGKVDVTYSLGKEPTLSQQNAVKKAQSYLNYTAFSRSGLVKQLEYEGFSKSDATYGVDGVTVDWNEQAVKKAESYLSHTAFSRQRLIDQLKYEGFTQAQAKYAVDQVGL